MQKSYDSASAADAAHSPTPFNDLNQLLSAWLAGVRRALGEVLVGAYLQGSFALKDADEASDCDFMVAVSRDLTGEEVAALNDLHGEIFDLLPPWSRRLEGSYVPLQILRALTPEPRDPPGEAPRPATWEDPAMAGSPPRLYPLWFLSNGDRALVRSEHDNSQVIRWVTREHGIVLAGPSPTELIDPVPPEALKAEIRTLMRRLTPVWTSQPSKMDRVWLPAYFTILYARMLHTLETGQVHSKRAAAAWALDHLERRWQPLLKRAQAERELPLEAKMAGADRAVVAETLAFMRHALRRSAQEAAGAKADPSHQQPGRPIGPSRGFAGMSAHGRSAPPPIRPGGRGRRG